MTEQRHPQSLQAAFAAAEAQREAIERGAFHSAAGTATGARYCEAVLAALAAYEDCGVKVASLGLFSTNETVDEMATKHLPYLLVPYYVAEVVQRLPASNGGAENRRAVLRRARHAYEQFLHSLDAGEMLLPAHERLLRAYTEDPQHFSTTGASAAVMDANERRNAKIAFARSERNLRTKLGLLKQRQQERREQRRRRRQQLRSLEEEDERKDESNTNNDDDDDDRDDEDEEVARELYLTQLTYAVHMAFQSLEMLNREDEMLARAPPPTAPQTQPQTADARQRTRNQLPENERSGSTTAYTERLETVPRGPRGTGPLLSKDGKPLQPFTIVGSSGNIGRQDLAKGVFRPGHNLPTMSIDEYLEEERRRGNIIEGGGPSSGLKPEPDEDDMEKADAETMKARAWDEFTEANPRGAGNTLNRG